MPLTLWRSLVYGSEYEENLELNQYEELLIKVFLLRVLLGLDRHLQTMALKAHCLKISIFLFH